MEKQKDLKESTIIENARQQGKNNVVMHLEDQYPLHDRRAEGYKLVGFHNDARPSKYRSNQNGPVYPYGAVPVWRYLGWDMNSKYSGAQLRALRKERGVGKRPKGNA